MKCKMCKREYGISDDGPWIEGEGLPLILDDGTRVDSWEFAKGYNYAYGLCIECHDRSVELHDPGYDEDDIPF